MANMTFTMTKIELEQKLNEKTRLLTNYNVCRKLIDFIKLDEDYDFLNEYENLSIIVNNITIEPQCINYLIRIINEYTEYDLDEFKVLSYIEFNKMFNDCLKIFHREWKNKYDDYFNVYCYEDIDDWIEDNNEYYDVKDIDEAVEVLEDNDDILFVDNCDYGLFYCQKC